MDEVERFWYALEGDAESMDLFQARSSRVSIVIPTWNEEAGLTDIISHCRPYADEILIVDGHSSDRTREIAQEMGASVILDHGRGKGDAIRTAIGAVTGDIIVFIDADYSHNPRHIPRLLAPILRGEADHVSGSRTRGGSDELHGDLHKFMRMIGSDIITLGINYRFNVRLTDSQNGFRAIRASIAKQLGLREDITTIEQEMTIKTLSKGYRMTEVPMHEYARRFGESRIALWKVSWRYVYSWLKYLAVG